MTTICVVEKGSGFAVELDGAVVTTRSDMDGALKITALLARCHAGDQSACAELDALGLEPPMLEPDDAPLPTAMAGDPEHWGDGIYDDAPSPADELAGLDVLDVLVDIAAIEGAGHRGGARRINGEWVPAMVRIPASLRDRP